MPACSAQPASPAPRPWAKRSLAGALLSWRQGLSVRALSHDAPWILAAYSGHMTHTGHSTPTGTGIHVTLHRAHTPHSTRDGRTDAHTDLAELGMGAWGLLWVLARRTKAMRPAHPPSSAQAPPVHRCRRQEETRFPCPGQAWALGIVTGRLPGEHGRL